MKSFQKIIDGAVNINLECPDCRGQLTDNASLDDIYACKGCGRVFTKEEVYILTHSLEGWEVEEDFS